MVPRIAKYAKVYYCTIALTLIALHQLCRLAAVNRLIASIDDGIVLNGRRAEHARRVMWEGRRGHLGQEHSITAHLGVECVHPRCRR